MPPKAPPPPANKDAPINKSEPSAAASKADPGGTSSTPATRQPSTFTNTKPNIPGPSSGTGTKQPPNVAGPSKVVPPTGPGPKPPNVSGPSTDGPSAGTSLAPNTGSPSKAGPSTGQSSAASTAASSEAGPSTGPSSAASTGTSTKAGPSTGTSALPSTTASSKLGPPPPRKSKLTYHVPGTSRADPNVVQHTGLSDTNIFDPSIFTPPPSKGEGRTLTDLGIRIVPDNYKDTAEGKGKKLENVLTESEAKDLPDNVRKAVGLPEIEDEYVSKFLDGITDFVRYAKMLGRFQFGWGCPEEGVYEWYWHPKGGKIWLGTSIMILLMSAWFCINLVALFLNVPRPKGLSFHEMRINGGVIPEAGNLTDGWGIRAEELYTFGRNVCSILIYWSMLLHLCISIYKAYLYRETQITFMTYLTNSLATMKVHSGEGMERFVTKVLSFYLGFMCSFIIVGIVNLIPVTSGAPAMYAILMARVIQPEIHTKGRVFTIIKWFMQLFFLYIMLCSKTIVMFYIIQCRVIRESFHNWNQRLDIVLNRGENFAVYGMKYGKRTSFRQLFEDHTILLDLLEGHDEYYADTIESYYMSQVISICFEFYYLYRSVIGDEFQESRRFDTILIGGYSFHSLAFMVFTCLASSGVADSSMDGLEAVRRKGMCGKRTPEELYFLMSLYVSYGGHFQTALSGSGCYTHDKTFLTTLLGTIFSYFIILIQFKTPLEYSDQDMNRLVDTISFLRFMEDTRDIFQGYDSGYLTYLNGTVVAIVNATVNATLGAITNATVNGTVGVMLNATLELEAISSSTTVDYGDDYY